MQEVFDEVGKEAVKKLKKTSPVNPKGKQSGRYAKGWAYEKGKKYRGKSVGVVRNKTDPQLTHLLEKPHETGGGGHYPKKANYTGTMAAVEEKYTQKYYQEVRDKL